MGLPSSSRSSLNRLVIGPAVAPAPRRGLRAARAAACVFAAACWAAPTSARAQTPLNFDPLMNGSGSDGSGTWDFTTPIWAFNGSDAPYTDDPSDATFGFNSGSGAYTVTLGTNITGDGFTVNSGGPGSSYTFNGNGFSYNASAVSSAGLAVNGGNVTLTNGKFNIGLPSSATNQTNFGVALLSNGGSLTVGAGATLAASDISSDGSANTTVRFNGGTFRPLANYNVSTDANGNFSLQFQLDSVTNAYIAAGGLTLDSSQVVPGVPTATSYSLAFIASSLTHDPAVTGTDGGLTMIGGGYVQFGFQTGNASTNINSIYSYNGPTNVSSGLFIADTSANTATTGPFPNTQFVIGGTANTFGEVNVEFPDGIAGATGTTPVTVKANGYLVADNVPVHLRSVTSTGGTLASFAGDTTDVGSFIFPSGAEYHVTASATGTATAPTVSTAESTFLTLESGADIRVDANSRLNVFSGLADDAAGQGQLTVNGAGLVNLYGVNTYNGSTTVNGGTVTLSSTYVNGSNGVRVYTPGTITNSKVISIAAGASLTDSGLITSVPAVTVNGTLGVAGYPGEAASVAAVNFSSISLASSTALVSLSPAAAAFNTTSGSTTVTTPVAPRILVVTGALTFAGTTNAWLGKFNIQTGDVDVQNGNLSTLSNQTMTGYNSGGFNGYGIYSSTARNDTRKITAVGTVLNNDGTGNRLFGSGTTLGLFDGANPAITDVLIRYTYFGDANLDGRVNGADYARIDAGYNSRTSSNPLTGWYNGDFNYDGKVDGSDYTLIDNAFNLQGTAILPSALGGTAGAAVGDGAFASSQSMPAYVRQTAGPGEAGLATTVFGAGGQMVAAATGEVAPVAAAVPEPATASLLAIGGAALLAGRRRRHPAARA